MTGLLGSEVAVFVGITVLLFGFGAFLTGQAVAERWQGAPLVLTACFGLAVCARLLTAALYHAPLTPVVPLLVAYAYLAAIGLLGWRLSQVRKMVTQYPWLYERAGLLAWRDRR